MRGARIARGAARRICVNIEEGMATAGLAACRMTKMEKSMQSRWLSIFVLVAAAGCASTQEPETKDAARKCEVQYRTGSNIPLRDCETLPEPTLMPAGDVVPLRTHAPGG
jgi:hypothetical protein